jgi:hypothetical protein
MISVRFSSGLVRILMSLSGLPLTRPYVIRENQPKAAARLSARPKPLMPIAIAQVQTDWYNSRCPMFSRCVITPLLNQDDI